ncbi:alpha-L-arabinofuranosidase C-terminal domain-containing protein [Ferruginibacter paludis]|uniref:alpha-L-arabinofuranosidase C-terminal domain-containing protein n=1 Tax=Ferruginibacter paludis TaxID=1310417 RepID=UPI0025B3B307|nr:alpha-L-arabinofuranosidase C-terminal domain-containing protein [Ferruginibacter paludis]MDN3655170.1 alpha-L-arabinofuranosidase C-terminal domain-containing protein [Ferruginibacter paludis]
MKKILAVVLLTIPILLHAQTAKIKIDPERSMGEIDPKIYGVFMEPIQISGRRGLPDSPQINTLYGTIYDPASPLADENGFKKNYIEAMSELKVTNMRWPGGNFLMGYNWQDGIGAKEKRPARINMAWGGIDNNHVGTDEWFALNKSIGSENVVAVNLGLGTIQDAAYWLEYCNYPKGTYYSDLRAKNGHPAPYKVKIWDLGNEVDGKPWELGHKNAEDYIEVAREAAKAMRAVDSSIELVGCGSSWYSKNAWDDWNRKVLYGIGDKIKYLSIHSYWENSPDYYTHMGDGAKIFDDRIKITSGEIEAVSNTQGFKNPIYISVDEWGAFGRNFMSVLPVAQSFNSFIRHAEVVKMSNFTLLTSLLSSDPKKGTFKSPLFYIFKAYSNNCLGTAVDTYVECDTFNTEKYKGMAYLDVSTTFSKEANAVFVNVVNRHRDKAITTDIVNTSGEFTGKAEASIITGKDMQEAFAFDKQQEYEPAKTSIETKNNKLTCNFPPHSFTQVKVMLKRK